MLAQIVLVVADLDLLHKAQLALERAGLSVVAFSNSLAALKALEGAQTVEVLVTGLNFPGRQPNGMSLALMTEQRRPNLRLVFLGPAAAAPVVQDLGQLLVEPVAVSDLVAAVRRAVYLIEASVPSERERFVRRSF